MIKTVLPENVINWLCFAHKDKNLNPTSNISDTSIDETKTDIVERYAYNNDCENIVAHIIDNINIQCEKCLNFKYTENEALEIIKMANNGTFIADNNVSRCAICDSSYLHYVPIIIFNKHINTQLQMFSEIFERDLEKCIIYDFNHKKFKKLWFDAYDLFNKSYLYYLKDLKLFSIEL